MSLTNLVGFLITFITIFGRLIVYAIIARIIISWLQVSRRNFNYGKFSKFLFDITEPFIGVARKIPHRIGMFDLSPLIAIIAIDLLVEVSAMLLLRIA